MYLKTIFKKPIDILRKKITPLPVSLRHDDIYLVSFPRSGNTWLSFLITNAIFEYLSLDIKVNFYNFHFFVPDIHVNKNIPEKLLFPPFRRIIKSHYKFSPYYPNVILLIRDPRDLMISYYHFRKNFNQFNGDISSFIRDRRYGIRSWLSHTQSWLNKPSIGQRIKIFFYEKFRENPEKELKKVFKLMGFDLADEIIKRAIEKSDFEKMRRLEEETDSHSRRKYQNYKFMRKGIVGQAKEELSREDLKFIEEIAGDTMEKLGYKIER